MGWYRNLVLPAGKSAPGVGVVKGRMDFQGISGYESSVHADRRRKTERV